MLLSIIIPSYNADKYIENCVLSIYDERFIDELEILVIDDGSIDTTGDVCRKLMTRLPNLKYFYQNNQGVSSARNFGISLASGQYIGFIDSDDRLSNDAIAKLIAVIKNNNEDIYYYGYVYVNQFNKTKVDIPKAYNNEDFDTVIDYFEYCAKNNEKINRHVWGWIVRKSIIENNHIRFDTNYTMGEDFDFCMEVACCSHSIKILPEVYYEYRYNPKSVTQTTKAKHVLSELRIADKWLKRLETQSSYKELKTYFSNFFCASLSRISNICDVENKKNVLEFASSHYSNTQYSKGFKYRVARFIWFVFGIDVKVTKMFRKMKHK